MHCLCSHLTSFGGGFVVAPNPIDFDKVFEGFKNLSDNISVFATIITAFAIYILMAVWLRRKDKKDETMVSRTEISPHLLRGFLGCENIHIYSQEVVLKGFHCSFFLIVNLNQILAICLERSYYSF